MPGFVRKLLVFAVVDGLVLQAQGHENQKAIHLAYKSVRITEYEFSNSNTAKKPVQLEAYGIIGLLSLASSTFLITIARREQIAQIYGRPVYGIADVAFLPLSSQEDAENAMSTFNATRLADNQPVDAEFTDSEIEDTHSVDTPRAAANPTTKDDDSITSAPVASNVTTIAQDVIAKRGQYAKFASQWLSRQGRNVAKIASSDSRQSASSASTKDEDAQPMPEEQEAGAEQVPQVQTEARGAEFQNPPAIKVSTKTSVSSMTSQILRRAHLILTSRSFYFSYDFDLTRRVSLFDGSPQQPSREYMDPLYHWNKNMARPFIEERQDAFVIPIMQGFVGQRQFNVKKTTSREHETATLVPVTEQAAPSSEHSVPADNPDEQVTRSFLLTLISRRSVKRSGLRYMRRGIDDEGNCANSVETEQILSSPDWDDHTQTRSFVQVRGSIPLFFSQSPYSLKPTAVQHQSAETNQKALKRHFRDLNERYGGVQIAMLVDKHGTESGIGRAFENTVKELSESTELGDVRWDWFDFHSECKGMKFENVSKLVEKLGNTITEFGETIIQGRTVLKKQKGIIRTNCMDCLDRTNVAESAFGQHMLQQALQAEGFPIDLVKDPSTQWFNTLWADNGDAISRLYAGTAALKGDFTRTRKRNYQGALSDFGLTLTRYYNNMVNDYFSQAVIDVLLGNLSWKVFEDFESKMVSADPGISIDNIRQTAIENCRKQVIQEDSEDLIQGWTVLVPAQENTLRTLPFQEAVLLLTDVALYCCLLDWNTEKLASFEKVDLCAITKIRCGTYITSTMTEREMRESLNAGLVVIYTPGQGSTIRVNTRSLQNTKNPAPDMANQPAAGIVSWLSGRSSLTSRSMAMKLILSGSDLDDEKFDAVIKAEHFGDEIVRAIIGRSERKQEEARDLLEKGDIISVEEARRRTGYLEQLSHSIKKFVYT